MNPNISCACPSGLRSVFGGACLYLIGLAVAFAIDDATLAIGRVEGQGWTAREISIRLDTAAKPFQADIAIAQIALTNLRLKIEHARIRCHTFEVSDDAYVCNDAMIALAIPDLGAQQLRAQVRYDRHTGAVRTTLKGFKLGEGGLADLTLESQAGREFIGAELFRVSASQLAQLAGRLGLPFPVEVSAGNVSGSLHAQSHGARIDRAQVKLTVEHLSVNNAAGTLATDNLNATIDGEVKALRSGIAFDGHLKSNEGQAYFEPIFFDTKAHAIDAQAEGVWSSASGLRADSFLLRHVGVLTASGSARIDFRADQPLRELKLSAAQVSFPGAYETYLQGFVANDAFKSLQTSGAATVSAEVSEGVPQSLQLDIQTLSADGKSVRIDGLQGKVNWVASDLRNARSDESALGWRAVSLYGLEFGAAQMRFQAAGHSFRLLESIHVPVMDGALDVETLRIRNFAQPGVAFLIDATVQPISVPRLCRAFGWPEFGGHIGGAISKLRMRDGVITLGTTLNGKVFDGSVSVRDLRLEQPFSNWPRFSANVAFDALNLEQVTSAFSFGRITGKLSGTLNGLELFNWAPVAFDARFYTPPTDRSKHRISQRAVESIGSLGGGGSSITAALSSGFLRFFADFNYDRLGLSCRLQNDVCQMDGIAPAPGGGYYLVKGWGVPRIDVIGNSRRVDWPRMVQQLKAATEADTVVVK